MREAERSPGRNGHSIASHFPFEGISFFLVQLNTGCHILKGKKTNEQQSQKYYHCLSLRYQLSGPRAVLFHQSWTNPEFGSFQFCLFPVNPILHGNQAISNLASLLTMHWPTQPGHHHIPSLPLVSKSIQWLNSTCSIRASLCICLFFK